MSDILAMLTIGTLFLCALALLVIIVSVAVKEWCDR